jgi:hypothetical protein
MDTRILRSAGKAAGIMICVSLIMQLSGWMVLGSGHGSTLLTAFYSVIAFTWIVLSTPILGFMSVYFFRKEKGVISIVSYTTLVLSSAVMYTLFTSLFSWISIFIRGSAYFADDMLTTFLWAFLLSIALPLTGSLIGTSIGSLLAVQAMLDKREKQQPDVRIIKLSTAIMLILITGFVFWQLAPSAPNGSNAFSTGFVKMQPLTSSVSYHNTSFIAPFTNALGTKINLENITISEGISGDPCPSVRSSSEIPSSVKAGGTFTLTGVCPPKSDGESYDLIITIKYSATMGNITTNHTDTGHIKGEAEAL